MKKILLLFGFLFLLISCDFGIIKKPKNQLSREQMVDMIYDLSVLEAMKSQNTSGIIYPSPTQLLKKKYQIDSLTFAQNSKYYSADIKEYKKIYAEVQARLEGSISKFNGGKKQVSQTRDLVN